MKKGEKIYSFTTLKLKLFSERILGIFGVGKKLTVMTLCLSLVWAIVHTFKLLEVLNGDQFIKPAATEL